MRITTVLVFLLSALLGSALMLHAFANDPSPRFQLLGRELLDTPNSGSPAKVFVYKDRATNNEILCFAGEMRETLSCFQSGRSR